MKKLKKFISNIDKQDFRRYLIFSIILLITIIAVGSFKLTQARYESSTMIKVSPNLAFFVVDVGSQTGQIQLEGMLPREEAYLYTFNVSNFQNGKRANVDLTYSIEIITTTNMPLNFRIFKGSGSTINEIDSDTINTDTNGVFYRHLLINDVSTFSFNSDSTDIYTLWVEFPVAYKSHPAEYAGLIDLVDIKINAEQVV